MSKTDEEHTADILADQLDALLPPGEHNGITGSDDPLLNAAAWFASLASDAPPPRMSDEVLNRIEARVLAAAKPVNVIRPKFWTLSRLAAVASFALVFMAAGATSASLGSIPGDALYPLKQTVEKLEHTLAFSPESRASVYLTQADRRAYESAELVEQGQDNLGVMLAAYDSLVAAAQIANQTSNFNASVREQLTLRSVALDAQLGYILNTQMASGSGSSHAAVAIYATQVRPDLLLPPPAEPSVTPSPIPTLTPTLSPEPSVTPTAIPTLTPVPSATGTPLPSETPTVTTTPTATTLPINLIIEGPITSVDGNIIVIYDIPIVLSPDDPLLNVVQTGDVIRVEGNIQDEGLDTPVTVIEVTPVNDNIAVNDNGQTWRDTGDCSNPPPSWATANGWRVRCEGAAPANNAGGNSTQGNNAGGNSQDNNAGGNSQDNNAGGNSQGNAQGNNAGGNSQGNNAGGRGQGQGNSDDDD